MTVQQTEYAEQHQQEMLALVRGVDAMKRGDQTEIYAWAQRLHAATNAKMRLVVRGMSMADADSARISAENAFEQAHPGEYQAARAFMYAIKARMAR